MGHILTDEKVHHIGTAADSWAWVVSRNDTHTHVQFPLTERCGDYENSKLEPYVEPADD